MKQSVRQPHSVEGVLASRPWPTLAQAISMALCLISNRRNSANTDSIRQAKEQSYPWNKQTNGFVVNTPKQITLLFRFSGDSLEAKYFELNRNTGQIYAKASIPENEFVQPVTLVIKATQYDNPDRYTVTTLTVTRDGQVGGGEFWKILSNSQSMWSNYPFFKFLCPNIESKHYPWKKPPWIIWYFYRYFINVEFFKIIGNV